MAVLATLHAVVHGYVQGVFFRTFVAEKANQLGLTGYVRNLSSGEDVEVQAEGEREKLERLVEFLKSGPPLARVDRVSTGWSKYSGKHPQFIITG